MNKRNYYLKCFTVLVLLLLNSNFSFAQIQVEIISDCTEKCSNYPDCLNENIDCITNIDLQNICKEGCPNYPCCLVQIELEPCNETPCNVEVGCVPGSLNWPDCINNTPKDLLEIKEHDREVGKYEKLEIGLLHNEAYTNPYNPNEVSVEAEFTSPSGLKYDLFGFYYQDFTRTAEDWIPIDTDCPWRLRFAPMELGDWTYTVKIVANGITTHQSEEKSFECVESENPGPLKIADNNRYLEFENGESFFGIAQDLRGAVNLTGRPIFWPDCTENGGDGNNDLNCNYWCYNRNTLIQHKEHISEFKSNGGNLVRLWMEPHTYEIEWDELGNYDPHQNRAFDFDELVEHAADNDVYIHLVTRGITSLYHSDSFGQEGGEGSGWWLNPYHKDLGLPMPVDFFLNGTAIDIYKRRIRYIISRWGYSTAIASYSLLNEPEFLNHACEPHDGNNPCGPSYQPYPANRTHIFAWFRNIGEYIKELSFYPKMLTIDYATASPDETINGEEIIDYTNTHLYSRDVNQNYQFGFELNYQYNKWDKPAAITESGQGGCFIADGREIDYHNVIWSTGLSGQFSTNFLYGSIIKFNQPCYGKGSCKYLPFVKFMEGEKFNDIDFVYEPISNASAAYDEVQDELGDNAFGVPPFPYGPYVDEGCNCDNVVTCPQSPNNTYDCNGEIACNRDRYGFAYNRYGCNDIEEFFTSDITTSDNARMQVFGLKNKNRVLGWVHNKNYNWYNVFTDQAAGCVDGRLDLECGGDWETRIIGPVMNNCITERNVNEVPMPDDYLDAGLVPELVPLENQTITISNLECNGIYQVEWYSTQCEYDENNDPIRENSGGLIEIENTVFSPEPVTAENGTVTFEVPTLKPTEWLVDGELPYAPDYGFKLTYIGDKYAGGGRKHEWPGEPDSDHFVNGAFAINTIEVGNDQIFYRNSEGFMRHYFPVANSNTTWIHGALNHWTQPAENRIANWSEIVLNSKHQVFYASSQRILQYYSWEPSGQPGGTWSHEVVSNLNGHRVNGSITINLANDQIFYRSNSGLMRSFIPDGDGWELVNFAPISPSLNQRVAEGSPIRLNSEGDVFYIGRDNKLQYYFFDGNQWNHDWVDGEENDRFVDGDFTINTLNGNDQIFYRSPGGQIRHFFPSGNNQFIFGALNNWNQSPSQRIHPDSPIKVNSKGQVFYIGTDNRMQFYYWMSGGWNHGWLSGEFSNHFVDGDFTINTLNGNDQIYYRNDAGFMRHYFPVDNHDFIHGALNHWSQPFVHRVRSVSSLITNTRGDIFYIGVDRKLQYYYWENPCAGEVRSLGTDEDEEIVDFDDNDRETISEKDLLSIYPNPSDDVLNVRYTVSNEAKVEILIYDIYGRKKSKIVSGRVDAGSHNATLNTDGFVDGVYIVYYQSDGEIIQSKKLIIKH